jgi:hypothetical protein
MNVVSISFILQGRLPFVDSNFSPAESSPACLTRAAFPQLGQSLQVLSSLGFSREQVSCAILRCPRITKYK